MKERFSKLKYQISGLKEPVVERYPELLRYEPIAKAHKLKSFDSILRYIIFLYDPLTDLNNECPDLKDRKAEARALAELPESDFKKFNELESGYVALIQCFLCEIYHNRKHREWHTTLQELDDFTRMRWTKVINSKGEVSEDIDPKKRLQLSELCDSLNHKADLLEEEIFTDHEDVKEAVIADRWSSPEKFASPTLKLMSNG